MMLRAALLSIAVLLSLALIPPPATATNTATLSATITDAASGMPLADATLHIAELGLTTQADQAGAIRLSTPIAGPDFPGTITVSAPGYAPWTVRNISLRAADTLRLAPALGSAPTTIDIPGPAALRRPAQPADGERPASQQSVALAGSLLEPPATIRVRVTGATACDTSAPYTVVTLDFKDYVKHVLPFEWIRSWPEDSLKAGAMATKSYAWHWINRGGKWPDADVYDSTCDQVYKPGITYASTDAAIEASWMAHMIRSNAILHASYRAYWSQCQAANLAGSCMGQYESRDLAAAGMDWWQILRYFYANVSLGYPNSVALPLLASDPGGADALP
jgi:peptidoglycan hydrolase-like amidase